MKLFEKIQAITDKNLFDMTINDQYDLCKCYDELLQLRAEYSDKMMQWKQKIKDYEAEQMLLLKEEKIEETDAKGNPKFSKKYTEAQIESLIYQQTKDKITDVNADKFIYDKLDAKISAVFNYITCVRDFLRAPATISAE